MWLKLFGFRGFASLELHGLSANDELGRLVGLEEVGEGEGRRTMKEKKSKSSKSTGAILSFYCQKRV